MRAVPMLRFAFALAALAAPPAFAATPGEAGVPTRWRCHYLGEPQPAISCSLDVAQAIPVADLDPALDDDASPREFVDRIRSRPASLAGKAVRIPLWAPPIDMAFAVRLARAVMCGARAGCEVDFEAPSR